MSIVVNKTRLPVTQWQTESGSVVSVNDARKRYAKSLSVALEPIQDLHGYANPWVGGAGKNKFNSVGSLLRGYISSGSGSYISNNSVEWCAKSGLLPAGTYTISKIESTRFRVGLFASLPQGEYDMPSIEFWTASPQTSTSLTITTSADGYLIIFIFNGSVETHTQQEIADSIQIETGSTATAWTPYENLCPISGRSSVSVYDDPKYGGTIWWNQIITVSDFINGTHNGITYTKNDDGTITISGTLQSGATNTYRMIIASSKYVVGHKYFGSVGNKNSSFLFWHNASETLEKNEGIFTVNNLGNGFYVYRKGISGGYEINETLRPWCCDLTEMFGAGNEPTLEQFRDLFPKDYYEYNAGTETLVSAVNGDPYWNVSVSLGQTIYGGIVDLVSGIGTLTRACYSCTGASSETWQKSGRYPASFYRGWNNFNGKQYGAFTCSHAVFNSNFNTYKFGQCYSDTTCSLWIQNDTSMDTNGFKALLADYYNNGNPVQVCYELSTPITFQLTPTQIGMLMRNNTIWSDDGIVTVNYARIRS